MGTGKWPLLFRTMLQLSERSAINIFWFQRKFKTVLTSTLACNQNRTGRSGSALWGQPVPPNTRESRARFHIIAWLKLLDIAPIGA